MANPTLLQTALRFTQSIYYGKASVGSVPTTRNINTTAPITGGGNLAADLTLALTTSPAGQTPVGVTRLITGTTPILIDGAASADLSANRTISVIQFDSTHAGIVPLSGGGVVNFLRADGTWQAVAGGTGVPATRLINTTLPLTGGGDLSGDRTLAINTFSSITSGIVPASGGGTVNFLRADGTWATFAGGQFVTLQSVSPGSADTGHFNISGVGLASTGFTNSALLAAGTLANPVSIFPTSHAHGVGVDSYSNTAKFSGGFNMRRFRGTTSLPTAVQDADWLGVLTTDAQSPGGPTVNQNVLGVQADTPAASDVPIATFLNGGSASTTISYLWATSLGVLAGRSIASRPTIHSGFEVSDSFGLKFVAKTAAYVMTDNDCVVFIDTSAAPVPITIPSAAGLNGRILAFVRTDSGTNVNRASLVGTVSGIANPRIGVGQTLIIESDGTNWFRHVSARETMQLSNSANSTAIVNTGVKTIFDKRVTIPSLDDLNTGTNVAVMRFYASGVYSTDGAGTNKMQLFVHDNTNAQDIATSRLLTLHNSMSGELWTLDAVVTFDGAPSSTLHGTMTFYDDAGGDLSVNLKGNNWLPVFSQIDIGLMAQWTNPTVNNSIQQRRLVVAIDPQRQF